MDACVAEIRDFLGDDSEFSTAQIKCAARKVWTRICWTHFRAGCTLGGEMQYALGVCLRLERQGRRASTSSCVGLV